MGRAGVVGLSSDFRLGSPRSCYPCSGCRRNAAVPPPMLDARWHQHALEQKGSHLASIWKCLNPPCGRPGVLAERSPLLRPSWGLPAWGTTPAPSPVSFIQGTYPRCLGDRFAGYLEEFTPVWLISSGGSLCRMESSAGWSFQLLCWVLSQVLCGFCSFRVLLPCNKAGWCHWEWEAVWKETPATQAKLPPCSIVSMWVSFGVVMLHKLIEIGENSAVVSPYPWFSCP